MTGIIQIGPIGLTYGDLLFWTLLIGAIRAGARRADWYKVNVKRHRDMFWTLVALGALLAIAVGFFVYTRFSNL